MNGNQIAHLLNRTYKTHILLQRERRELCVRLAVVESRLLFSAALYSFALGLKEAANGL